MMGRKQKLKTGAEHDVLYGCDYYAYLDRPKVKKKIRKGMNKRERREAKEALRGDAE